MMSTECANQKKNKLSILLLQSNRIPLYKTHLRECVRLEFSIRKQWHVEWMHEWGKWKKAECQQMYLMWTNKWYTRKVCQ